MILMIYGKMNRHKHKRPKLHKARSLRKAIAQATIEHGASCAEAKFLQRCLAQRIKGWGYNCQAKRFANRKAKQ